MDLMKKLEILTDKRQVRRCCTSSGVDRSGDGQSLGSAVKAGICHAFAADGRCISLLKVLLTNVCIYNCKYCVNRASNDVPRAAFTPRELAELTIQFYRRNYIEGLFLSSAVIPQPGLYHGTDDRRAGSPAQRVPISGIHSRESHPRWQTRRW